MKEALKKMLCNRLKHEVVYPLLYGGELLELFNKSIVAAVQLGLVAFLLAPLELLENDPEALIEVVLLRAANLCERLGDTEVKERIGEYLIRKNKLLK